MPNIRSGINLRAIMCHSRIPGLRKLPLPAVAIIVGLILVNALVWLAVGIVLVRNAVIFRQIVFHRLRGASTIIRETTNTSKSSDCLNGKAYLPRALISTALLSYTLGLRHALDADHISVMANPCMEISKLD